LEAEQEGNTQDTCALVADVAREERLYTFRLCHEPLSWVSSVGEVVETTPEESRGRMNSLYTYQLRWRYCADGVGVQYWRPQTTEGRNSLY